MFRVSPYAIVARKEQVDQCTDDRNVHADVQRTDEVFGRENIFVSVRHPSFWPNQKLVSQHIFERRERDGEHVYKRKQHHQRNDEQQEYIDGIRDFFGNCSVKHGIILLFVGSTINTSLVRRNVSRDGWPSRPTRAPQLP